MKPNKTSERVSLRLAKISVTVVLTIVAIIVLVPLYYLVLASFTDTSRLFTDGLTLVPRWDRMGIFNYLKTTVERDGAYWTWYLNSIVVAAIFTTGALFFTAMVGYGLGTYHFRGRTAVFILVLVAMMIPIEILMLPLYSLTVKWGIINSKAGVILPFMLAGNSIFFFRQFSTGLPIELKDAGRIDGATEYGIYFKIMAPLMRPAFGAMTILLAMMSWNMFVWPLIVLQNSSKFTLPIGLASLLSPYGNNYALLLPGAVLAIVPVVIIFLFNQKSFVAGLASGGVKG